MSETFDPYHAWLGIPPDEQPPNHYRLLGVQPFEEDSEAIAAAADRRTGNLHVRQTGSHAELARRLLSEVADAKACLLSPTRKAAYDRGLRESLQAGAAEAKQSDEVQRARTHRFLAVLEEKDLLPAELIEGLRKQVVQSKVPVLADFVAKRLIEAGHLTAALAERLLAASSDEVSPPAESPAQKSEDETGPASPEAADDELRLVPLDDEPRTRPRAAVPEAPPERPPKTPAEETGPRQPQRPTAASASGSLVDEEPPRSTTVGAAAAGMEPLGELVAEPDFDAAAAGGPLAVAPRKRRGPKAIGWGSALFLVGLGALLILTPLFIVLVWSLTRQTGDEALRQANEDYRNGSYTQAIDKYNQYLKKFRNHSGVSLAKVNRGLAQLRQVTPRGTREWSGALEVAQEVLPEIAREGEEFRTARDEVSAILLTIAQGLAAQARQDPNPALVAQTRETLALMKQYVPKSPLLRGREVSDVETSLALTEHEIARGDRLNEAIADIKQAVAAGNTEKAYAIRKTLLKDYPLLADNEQLKQALIEVSQAQQKAVEFVEKRQPPEAGEPEPRVLATLARRTVAPGAPRAAGHVVYALADGAAYGLDAATGEVLWRRFVGFDANGRRPSFPPTPLSPEPGSDVLLVDSLRGELLRVEATTGLTRWRHAAGEPFDAHPLIADGQVLLATRSGRLIRIDAAGGGSSGYVRLPQPLRVAPAFDPQHSLFFQVADHSNLFVLALADGRCTQVVHLGHELGSITAPPVVAGRLLLVAVNDRARDSTLHVLSVEEGKKGPWLKPAQQLRLRGHVDTPPLVDGRSVLVATDTGVVFLFELSGIDTRTPLRKAAEPTPAGQEQLVRFPLIEEGQIWIAGTELTKYSVEISRGRLVPRWTHHQGSAFQQPLAAIGRTIFHVRRKLGMPGVLVSAVDMDEGRQLWETCLAAPLPSEPLVVAADGGITAVTSLGAIYRVDAAGLKGPAVLDQPDVALDVSQLRQPISDVIHLEGGLLAMTAGEGSDRIAVFDPRRQQKPLSWLSLPDRLACPPIAFAGGLLAPCQIGQVFLIDPRSGDKQAEPFEPWLESGGSLSWRLPAVAGDREVVLADGRSTLYRVGIKDQPKPVLAALEQQQLSQPVVSPVAVVGEVAYAVDAAGALAVFSLPKLTPVAGKGQSLGGRCVWGPRRVGEHVMLSTDDDRLLCLDGTGELRWQIKMPYGPLAGPPLETGNHYVLAATGGVVWRIEAATGKEVGKIDTGRPLGTGPVLLGKHLLIGGRDGSLYKVKLP